MKISKETNIGFFIMSVIYICVIAIKGYSKWLILVPPITYIEMVLLISLGVNNRKKKEIILIYKNK